jgi:hypothetical protein
MNTFVVSDAEDKDEKFHDIFWGCSGFLSVPLLFWLFTPRRGDGTYLEESGNMTQILELKNI